MIPSKNTAVVCQSTRAVKFPVEQTPLWIIPTSRTGTNKLCAQARRKNTMVIMMLIPTMMARMCNGFIFLA